MRTTTAPELTVLAAATRRITHRVKVKNGSGTFIDLSAWVEGITIELDVDQPISGCTVEFSRASGITQSLSPLRTDSTLNRLDDTVTYSPQLDVARSITVEIATTEIGVAVVEGDYKLLFQGTIDNVNFERSPVSVSCRDLGAPLVDRWIEYTRDYGSVPGVALETVMQTVLDDAALYWGLTSAITLYTPVSPSYLVSPVYQQQEQSVMDALQALAQLPGWDVRFKWDNGTSTFRFTLSNPPRTNTTPDYTFGPGAYFDVRNLALELTDVRNVVRVEYPFQELWRLWATAEDTDSVTKYGRRFFLISEASTSPINTEAEALILANAALSDLKDPKAEQEIELPLFWPADLGDLYRFSANSVHYNANQDLAVVSIRHELSRDKHRTFLTVRGKPAGGYLTWLTRPMIAGGTPGGDVAPVAVIENLDTSDAQTVWNLRFSAVPGSGGGGANLSYVITSKMGFLDTAILESGDETALPRDIGIVRQAWQDTTIGLTVTDLLTGLFHTAYRVVPLRRLEIPDHGNPEEDRKRGGGGGYPLPGRKFHAEDFYEKTGSYVLMDSTLGQVGPLLKANDGEAGIESQRASTRNAAEAAGTGASGITEEEWVRGGCGGSPVPSGRVFALPIYSSDGGTPLLDTLTRRIQAAALGPTGVGMDTVEGGAVRANTALDATGRFKRTNPFDDANYGMAAQDTAGKTVVADMYVPSGNLVKIGTLAAPSTRTKTLRVSHAAFAPDLSTYTLANTLSPAIANTLMSVAYGVIFPVGVTIIAVRYRCNRVTTNDRADLAFSKLNDTGGGTVLATLVHATTGWATLSASISQLVGGESFMADAILKGVANAADAVGLWLEFDYTVPDYLTSY